MRTRQRLVDGWWLHVGEFAEPPGRGSSKAGGCAGFSDLTRDEHPTTPGPSDDGLLETMIPGFTEVTGAGRPDRVAEGWRQVQVPHDWRIEQTPRADGPIWQAFLPAGVAYYRRLVAAPPYDPDVRIHLDFDGVMRDTTVWLNGFLLGDHLSGYTGFGFDVTELLRYRGDGDGDNVLLVRCDTTTPEGWWYEGGGIYRDVWFSTMPGLHVDLLRTQVTTPRIDADSADVDVTLAIRNDTAEPAEAIAHLCVSDPNGHVVAAYEVAVSVPAMSMQTTPARLHIPTPILWDIGRGNLYTLEIALDSSGTHSDHTEVTFGIRTAEFRGGTGFVLNGRPCLLRGANIHQTFAGVGAALPERLVEHKLKLLQDMGCNAVRTAHHPPAPAVLDAADRLGMLIIAENRLLSTAPPYLDDLRGMIWAGRNHPCVFLWSLENEEYLEATPRGTRLLEALVREVRRLDPSRPTTVGGPRSFESPYFDSVDVVGAHYQSLNQIMSEVHQLRPSKPVIADEEGLFPTVRGQYHDDEERGLASAFGTAMGLYGAFPKIMAHLRQQDPIEFDHGATWRWFEDHPESGGGFVWAGIDYFGEPTPMRWPVRISNYGTMDICGFPKDYYWLVRSFFRDEPLIHLVPHWTWPGHEGMPLRMWAYTNCDEVELLVNGATIDRRPARDHVVKWEPGITYEPGIIEAVGLRGGQEVARFVATTAGTAAALDATVAATEVRADGVDVALITIEIADADGNPCPWADHDVLVRVDGPADLIGLGNGDPTSLQSPKGHHMRAFRGKLLAILRSRDGDPGVVHVRLTSEGLAPATAQFTTAPVSPTSSQSSDQPTRHLARSLP